MFSKNHPIILFLDRSGFSIFQDTLPNIAKFTFTSDIVVNLDVVNKEQFSNLIATFIQINKILPSSLALVLSDNIIYEKDLPLGLEVPGNIDKEHKEGIQEFLEDIPFEEVLAKVIKTDKSSRIVAVNKDLVMTIADVFANKGSTIEAIIPSFMYGPNVNFAAGLTQNNIQVILEESEILRTGNLLTDQQRITSPQSLEIEQKEKEKKPQNVRQYLLVGVFVTLLVILAVVYLNLGASKTPPRSSKIKSSVGSAIIVPTTPPAESDSAPAGGPSLAQTQISTIPIDLKSVKIKIVQSSQSDTIANNLRNELIKIGFEDIVSETSEETVPEKSSVIFSQNVPADVRERAFAEIKKILPNVSILENQIFDLTITILIGKS